MKITTPSACMEAEKENVARVVLMPGDPLRAQYVAENFLEDPILFNDVRNMYGYTGTYKGKKISVMGSGMGIPSIGIYAHDLYTYFDVDAIIRIGSAGAVADDVHTRDVVIAMSASTNSNFAEQFHLQGTLAPTADYEMLKYAVEAGEKTGAVVKVGSIYSSDTFYNADPNLNDKIRELGMLCVEMETAGLYMTAASLHKKALGILTISDEIFTGKELSVLERQESFDEMIEIALETAWNTTE